MGDEDETLRWSSIGKFDDSGSKGDGALMAGEPAIPLPAPPSAPDPSDGDPLLKPNLKWEEMMKRLDTARSRLLDDDNEDRPPSDRGAAASSGPAAPTTTQEAPGSFQGDQEPILLPPAPAKRSGSPDAADHSQPAILLPPGPSPPPEPYAVGDDVDDGWVNPPETSPPPSQALVETPPSKPTPAGSRYSNLMGESPSSSHGGPSPAAVPPPGASDSPVMPAGAYSSAAPALPAGEPRKLPPTGSSPLGLLPPAPSAAPAMPFPPGEFLGQALMSSPLLDGVSAGAEQGATASGSRRTTRESDAPSLSFGIGASSPDALVEFAGHQHKAAAFEGGAGLRADLQSEIDRMTVSAREAEPMPPRSASSSPSPAVPSWYSGGTSRQAGGKGASSRVTSTGPLLNSSARRTYTYTSAPERPYSSPAKASPVPAALSSSIRSRSSSPPSPARSYGSPAAAARRRSTSYASSPIRRSAGTSPVRSTYSPVRAASTRTRATSTSPSSFRRPYSPPRRTTTRATSPPPFFPSPSSMMSSSSFKARVEDDLAILVRRVLSESSNLQGTPSRLELRVVAQEMVAQVQGYFAKLESTLPAKLSYEDERGGFTPASESLSARLAAVGAGLQSNASRPTTQSSPPRPWSSPQSRATPMSFESWKYTDKAPPASSPNPAATSPLDSFTRRWQAMGKGTDGRPLSPSARLRQEKLRLAQRSADLIDEKLQAFGISPVRAARHYPVGSGGAAFKSSTVPAAAFKSSPVRRASSPARATSPPARTVGAASADILERLRRIEAGLSNTFKAARATSPGGTLGARVALSRRGQDTTPPLRRPSNTSTSRPSRRLSREQPSGALLREAWSRTTSATSPRPTSSGLDRISRFTSTLKSSTKQAGPESSSSLRRPPQPAKRDWAEWSDALSFSKDQSQGLRDHSGSSRPLPLERRLTLSKVESREASTARPASQSRVLGSAYDFLQSPTGGGSSSTHSTLRLLPSSSQGGAMVTSPASDRISAMAAEFRRRHP